MSLRGFLWAFLSGYLCLHPVEDMSLHYEGADQRFRARPISYYVVARGGSTDLRKGHVIGRHQFGRDLVARRISSFAYQFAGTAAIAQIGQATAVPYFARGRIICH